MSRAVTAAAVRFVVKSAPVGADLTFEILAGGVLWMTLTIAAGTTSVEASAVQLSAAAVIAVNAIVTLDITAVGTTFPGGDLSGAIFF
jgi:hypothetical protein